MMDNSKYLPQPPPDTESLGFLPADTEPLDYRADLKRRYMDREREGLEPKVEEYINNIPGGPGRDVYDYPQMILDGKAPVKDEASKAINSLPVEYYKKGHAPADQGAEGLVFDVNSGTMQPKAPGGRVVLGAGRDVVQGAYELFIDGPYTAAETAVKGLVGPHLQMLTDIWNDNPNPKTWGEQWDETLQAGFERYNNPPLILPEVAGGDPDTAAGIVENISRDVLTVIGSIMGGNKITGVAKLNPIKANSFYRKMMTRIQRTVTQERGVVVGEMIYSKVGEEGNLSTLLNDMGWGNELTEFLDSSDLDDESHMALKNVLEGVVLSKGIQAFMAMGRGGKALYQYSRNVERMPRKPKVGPGAQVGAVGDLGNKPVRGTSLDERLEKYATPDERELIKSPANRDAVNARLEIAATVDEVVSMAGAGAAKRGWYRASVGALRHVFGEDAERFAALLSATSPQTSVESNLRNALNIWRGWIKEGRPTDSKDILRIMGENVEGTKGEKSVMDAWKNNSMRALQGEGNLSPISGPKVDSFMRNLAGFFNEVTQDTWMARGLGLDQSQDFSGRVLKAHQDELGDVGVKGPGYVAGNLLVREAAERMKHLTGDDWTAAEIQETVWSWVKTIYEARGAKGEKRSIPDILKAGSITDDMIQDTPDFATMFAAKGEFREVLEESGYGEQLNNLPTGGFGSGKSVSGSAGQRRSLESSAERLERTAADADAAAAVKAADAKRHKDITKLYRDTITRPAGTEGTQSRSFRRRVGRSRGSVLGGTAHTTYTLPKGVQAKFNEHGIPTPPLHEFDNPTKFVEAITAAKTSQKEYGAAVHIYSPEEYANMRTFVTADGSAGFAIKQDGDLVSVFNTRGGKHTSVGPHLSALAVEQGATKLDAFNIGGFLPKVYGKVGFKPVEKLDWDDAYAPEAWDYKALKRPKVWFMELK